MWPLHTVNARDLHWSDSYRDPAQRPARGSAGAEGALSVEKSPPRERMAAWPKPALQQETEVGREGGYG